MFIFDFFVEFVEKVEKIGGVFVVNHVLNFGDKSFEGSFGSVVDGSGCFPLPTFYQPNFIIFFVVSNFIPPIFAHYLIYFGGGREGEDKPEFVYLSCLIGYFLLQFVGGCSMIILNKLVIG